MKQREHARDALAVDARHEVHARADDVERPDDRERQPAVLPVRPDHALEQLLGAGVGPALAVRRARETAPVVVLVHLGASARPARVERRPSVDLGRSRSGSSRSARARAQLHERHEVGEVGVDHLERHACCRAPGLQSAVSDSTSVGARGHLVDAAPGLSMRASMRRTRRAVRSSLSKSMSTASIGAAERARPARGTRCEPRKPPAPSTAIALGASAWRAGARSPRPACGGVAGPCSASASWSRGDAHAARRPRMKMSGQRSLPEW